MSLREENIIQEIYIFFIWFTNPSVVNWCALTFLLIFSNLLIPNMVAHRRFPSLYCKYSSRIQSKFLPEQAHVRFRESCFTKCVYCVFYQNILFLNIQISNHQTTENKGKPQSRDYKLISMGWQEKPIFEEDGFLQLKIRLQYKTIKWQDDWLLYTKEWLLGCCSIIKTGYQK